MNKRGLSTVVTVLIILLLTIVVLGILWFFVKDFIIKQAEFVKDREKFFTEELKIVKLRVEDKQFNITLRKTGGEIETTKEIVQEAIPMDVFSIIDVSGSMCACYGVTQSCCNNSLTGEYDDSGGQICWGVNTFEGENCTSICGGDFGDRITPTQNANRELIYTIFQEGSNARMGFVAYEGTVVLEDRGSLFNLTDDTIALNNSINLWYAGGGTCICCGINRAKSEFKDQSGGRSKTMIVMSDGYTNGQCNGAGEQGVTGDLDNDGTADTASDDAIQAAIDAKNDIPDLTIYTVGAGEGVDINTLRNISEAVGGEYFSATDIGDLAQVYEEIGERIVITHESKHSYKYILFIFSSETESYEMLSLEFPEVLGTKDYSFDLAGKLEGEITKIEIYPTIVLDSGRETIGPLMDTWESK